MNITQHQQQQHRTVNNYYYGQMATKERWVNWDELDFVIELGFILRHFSTRSALSLSLSWSFVLFCNNTHTRALAHPSVYYVRITSLYIRLKNAPNLDLTEKMPAFQNVCYDDMTFEHFFHDLKFKMYARMLIGFFLFFFVVHSSSLSITHSLRLTHSHGSVLVHVWNVADDDLFACVNYYFTCCFFFSCLNGLNEEYISRKAMKQMSSFLVFFNGFTN